jgi:penicillin-binding protein 1A
VYTADNRLIATFGETRRIPVKIDKIPVQVKNAFIAAEDARFYEHPGFDWQGVLRAGMHVIFSGGEKTQGASTITQQVARNFFLSSEKSYTRKLSELFLARRIEQALTKDEILELYLNKIFLGNRAYGVAAAAEFYYGKTLDQLTLPESAMLASLPKFPSTGNPLNNRLRAVERRNNYVLQRMLENNFITAAQFKVAAAEPDLSYAHEPPIEVEAPYLAEMARRDALERLGNEALTDGYTVHTTLDSRAQDAANQALRDDLISYDQRHGYRGPEAHVELSAQPAPAELNKQLDAYRPVVGLIPGIVTESTEKSALVYLDDGQSVPLELAAVSWAHAYQDESHRGPAVKRVDALLKVGDVVRLARGPDGKWKLSQVPAAQGALIALNPEDGAIQAEVGGFSYARSKFNRAVQSNRQPGSSFKPYFYAAAFEHGFTPASMVNDAPIVFADPSKPNGLWTPQNDDGKFDGPMRLREAMVQSKNLVSVRLLDAIGVRYAREYVSRFGIPLDQIPDNLSMALGTASVSPIIMARGFAVFANGGFLVDPYFIDSIHDRDGKEIYKAHPVVACRQCPDRLIEDARVAVTQASAEKAQGDGAKTTALSPIARAQAAATHRRLRSIRTSRISRRASSTRASPI